MCCVGRTLQSQIPSNSRKRQDRLCGLRRICRNSFSTCSFRLWTRYLYIQNCLYSLHQRSFISCRLLLLEGQTLAGNGTFTNGNSGCAWFLCLILSEADRLLTNLHSCQCYIRLVAPDAIKSCVGCICLSRKEQFLTSTLRTRKVCFV